MAQRYVGSNNMELLEPIGQFGSRILGGEDSAQPRYIHTHLSSNVEKLFNPLDENVYEYNYDDTLRVEPKYYVPLLPMILVNGSKGIGTGYSSDIPMFNPLELSQNIKNLIKILSLSLLIVPIVIVIYLIFKIKNNKFRIRYYFIK